jgi:O-antigen ligase
MTASINKTIILVAAAILLAGSFAAAYAGNPLLLLAPLALLVSICLLQYPQLLFYCLIASIPWSAEIHFSESLGTDLPDEPLMLLTAFAAIAMCFFKAKTKSIGRIHPLLFLLFISFCWLAVTVAVSTYPLFSVKYLLAKSWYLLAFVVMPLLLKSDESLLKNSAITLFVSMFTVILLVLYRHASFGFRFADVNVALQPFFRNHVNYSALLVLMTPLQIAFIRQTKSKLFRRALVGSFLLVVAALYLSYSRGAWLAFVIGLAGFWLIKKGWLFKTFLAFILLLSVGVTWLKYNDNYLQFAPNHNTTIFHQNFSEHLVATYKGKDVSTAERFYRWVAGAAMSGEKWFTGFGPTTFYSNYKSYTVPLFRTWVSDNKEHSTVHNYFLLLLIEQGIPGLLAFLLLIAAMFWYAQKIYLRTNDRFWKTTVAAIGAILLMQCTVNFLSDLVETDKVGSLFYLCIAALVMADRKQMTDNR